jgi:hypothetical protein
MITKELAAQYIISYSKEETIIRTLAKERILGDDMTTVGSGYMLEPSEDLLIQVLRNEALPALYHRAVINGCIDVYEEAKSWLFDNPRQLNENHIDAFTRLCSIVDMVSPPELKPYSDDFLLSIKKGNYHIKVFQAAIRAAMGYQIPESARSFWEEIFDNRETSAYAFNALLSIDPISPKINQYLKKLFVKQVNDKWPVDAPFLLRRAARLQKEKQPDQKNNLIYLVLTRLHNENKTHGGCWKDIQTLLEEQKWSKEWLKSLHVFAVDKNTNKVEIHLSH